MMSTQGGPDISQPSQIFYSYYPHDPKGSSELHATSPLNTRETNAPHEPAHRDVHTTQRSHPSFLAPAPPTPAAHASSSHTSRNVNPPPFSQMFCSSHHSPLTGSGAGLALGWRRKPPTMGYGGHVPTSAPRRPNRYPITSPVPISTHSLSGNLGVPPPHSYDSPQLLGGYLSLPSIHGLSRTSPATHLIQPGITPSMGYISPSSYPSVSKTLARLPRNTWGATSAGQGESWGEGEGEFTIGITGGTGSKRETDVQQWGMPEEEYKALNLREKKQVRNR